MSTIKAKFYDGKTSLETPVWIHLDHASKLRISGLDQDLIYGLTDVRISARVGDTPRSIYLPGGAMCETSENDQIDAHLRLRGRGGLQAVVHVLESKWRYVLFLLLVTIVGVWVILDYGIPALAKRVAYTFPTSADIALEQGIFQPGFCCSHSGAGWAGRCGYGGTTGQHRRRHGCCVQGGPG